MRALTHPSRASQALLVSLAIALTVVGLAFQMDRATGAPIYWGAYIKGDTYGYQDAPFDARTIDAFESHAGKGVSIVHWGQPWYWGSHGGYQAFRRDMVERVRQRGSIPMINWASWDLDRSGSVDQPDFRLSEIIGGQHDAYIRQWARDARAWGHPLLVRFDHEMNGWWFNWSERVNGNGPGQFVRMWRHVVDIFVHEGASNVTWVWAPNVVGPDTSPLASLYPGDGYVDWVGISGYNWGTSPSAPGNIWQSFSEVHRPTYDALTALAPAKPILIAETASTEFGGSKAAWITDALQTQLPLSFPRIKAVLWFNWNAPNDVGGGGTMDWVIESSPQARGAFAAGISSSYYASNTFGNLPMLSKVMPIEDEPPRASRAGPGPAARKPAAARPRARILSLELTRRCRPGRPLCVRLVWRAAPSPPRRVRFWVRVREAPGGRTLARRIGAAAGGRRHTVVLTTARRPRCGQLAVRLTTRAAGVAQVTVGRLTIRRGCVRPLSRAR
jgi:mannan endo-1,4-beta-mannosidase